LCSATSIPCPDFNDLRGRIWEDDTRRRQTMDIKDILNTPSKAKETARFKILTRLPAQYGAVSEKEITGRH